MKSHQPGSGAERGYSAPDPGVAGAAGLEFIIVAPLYLMLFFGVIIYGLYFFTLIGITNAASEAARASVAGLGVTERESLATAAANAVIASYAPLITPANATVVTMPSSTDANDFQVTITYNFAALGIGGLTILPIPVSKPSITVTVGNGL